MRSRTLSMSVLALTFGELLVGCSGNDSASSPGTPGGTVGSSVGSANSGGAAVAAGGQSAPNTPTTGGSASTNASIGGASNGGASTGIGTLGGLTAAGGVYVATTGSTPGGASTAGGTTASGGKASSGGTAALGGKTGSGGGQTGGANPGSGGVRSSGGTTGAGGSSKGGTTSSTSGPIGVGGSSATTPGCGKSTWPLTNDQTGGTPYTLTIDGTTREFYVNVPTTYQTSQPIRVVFAWHWLTATARSVIGGGFGGGAYYGLKSRIPNAIYIAAEGLGDNGQTGWANTNGRDIAFLRAMLDWLDANYCIDKSRIFSVGFSYGGIMSDTIACQLGTTFRAVAPIAGSMFGGARGCVNQPVAAHVIHGSADATLNISGGIAARDYFISTNHCTTTSQPLEPSPCIEYSGCDAGYPVVWCEHTGGHTVPSFASAAIATFFQRF